jgi:ABC-type Fe3+/spermidine/putrescine transport system ATPase subunit
LPTVELVGISNYALKQINLKIFDKELFVLLGKTGSGKTTLLNTIAGLKEYEGTIKFDNVSIDRVPTENRGIGYLFQNLLLFPHMDVYSNISYGLRIRNFRKTEISTKVMELAKLVRIEPLIDRYPKYLSGGEKQRVALARALAIEPKILLLDEPFNNLDPRTAKHLRLELKKIQQNLGITSIFVTHNLMEAEELADRIAIMNEGKIQQVGHPQEIFFSPSNDFVHDFLGAPNILECELCKAIGNDLAEVKANGISIVVPYEGEHIKRISIMPSEIFMSRHAIPGPNVNVFRGKIIELNHSNTVTQSLVEIENSKYFVESPIESHQSEVWEEGTEVFVKFRLKTIRSLGCSARH